MKIGIISFAHMHAHSYAESLLHINEAELVGIFDEDAERGQHAADQYQTTFYKDYQDLLNSDVEAVIVCSENVKHKEHVVASAQAGKHILCEKPIATTVSDAWDMIRAADKYGVKLEIAFPVRFSPAVQRVKRIVDEGKLGRILSMQGTNRGSNPGGWFVQPELSGGGAVLDHTVHIIDIMRWYIKSEVKEVYAEIDTHFSNIPADDCGLLTLEFENGVIASHDPSWSRAKSFPTWGDITLKLVGTEGTTSFDALSQKLDVYRDQSLSHQYSYWGDGYDLGLVKNFMDTVQHNKAPFISGVDGLRAMQVALAAYESSKTHQPVRVNGWG